MFDVAETVAAAYPDARAGILVMQGVGNPSAHTELDSRKEDLQDALRACFRGQDRTALENFGPIPAYAAYYRRFKKTYHVQAQLESVVFKGKSIPGPGALVEAMFMAELKNQLLTAGHDFDMLRPPLTLGVAAGSERYTLLRGGEQTLKAGDLFMADRMGVISSIIYGPDRRTQIRAETRGVLFAVYAPPGIKSSTVLAHIQDIRDYVLISSPAATVSAMQIFEARPG